MKTIKIDFCGFWGSFNKQNNFFTNILSKYFNVEISNDPDFVICSNRGKPFEYMKYDCVRIMFMGENISPDFTVFDYIIGFDFIDFRDRYFRLPFAFYYDCGNPWKPEKITEKKAKEILDSKEYFCNFIYGHQSSHGMREKLFQELCKYKKVISPGRYLNNMGTNGCNWVEKKEFVSKSKFTIAGDSISYPGFFTEKIIDTFVKHSIPIYFGNPEINKDINDKAFVWCKSTDEEEINRVIEEVKYLDENDDAYIEKLMEYPLVENNDIENRYEAIEKFLVDIFSQSKDEAYRRVRYFCAELHESYLRNYMVKNAWEHFDIKKAIKQLIKRK